MSKKQSLVAITFGALLVTSVAFAPIGGNTSPVQTAEAQDWVETCMVGPMMVIDVPALSGGQLCPNAESSIEELNATEIQETESNIYDSASTQKQNNENYLTSMDNYLNDTSSIAKMEGKNAYIRALENGSSEAEARNTATEAISEYYVTKQINVINQWNITNEVVSSMVITAKSTDGVSPGFVTTDTGYDDNNLAVVNESGDRSAAASKVTRTMSVSLVNGTSRPTTALPLVQTRNGKRFYVTIKGSYYQSGGTLNADSAMPFNHFVVNPPNDNFEQLNLGDRNEYLDMLTKIESQNDEIQNDLDTFINNTYEEYQRGQINTSDLVDPYLGSRNYDPSNGSSWALRSLTAMGMSPPENISITREMVISQSGVNYTGILMSDGLPESNAFTVGNTYNASNLTGHQFVALSDGGTHELEGQFTLESSETTTGETMEDGESISYETINYDTASTEEYIELQNQLNSLTQRLNELQNTIYAGGGGGGGGGPALPPWLEDKYFGVPLYGIILTGLAGVYVVNSFRRGS